MHATDEVNLTSAKLHSVAVDGLGLV